MELPAQRYSGIDLPRRGLRCPLSWGWVSSHWGVVAMEMEAKPEWLPPDRTRAAL